LTGRLAGERALVVGAGVAGVGAARVLVAEGAQVVVTDAKPERELASIDDLRTIGATVRAGGHEPEDLEGATVVVVAPGVPPTAPIVRWASERAIPIWGEMELGARLARGPYVGVTGTNGKSTVTAMVEACLREDGRDALACGNIGRSFPEAAREPHEILVVEVSSFQLEMQTSFHPTVSALLNVGPDHLDWHGSFEAYAAAKARIHAGQEPGDVHVGNRDDALAASISGSARCDVRWFRAGPPRDREVGYEGAELVARIDGERRLGEIAADPPGHRANAAAAAAVALSLEVDPAAAAAALAAFVPASHRGELVVTVDGVRFLDNSKATNVHAATAAILGVRDAVLIAGGRAKGADLTPLRAVANHLRRVVAIGESALDLVEVFEGLVPTVVAASIEGAVREAFAAARPDGTVLLAPACASWDQFADYAERGERFAAAARSLGAEVSARG
jgi:UDP-N-acetylmuramoylalanine--D-glutamate ligase